MSPSNRIKRLGLATVALVTSCQAPTVREVPEARIVARNDELAVQAVASLPGYDAEIRRRLGTDNGRSIVEVDLRRPPWHPGFWERSRGWVLDGVVVINHSDEDWGLTLAHELVHWHTTDHWNTLPDMIDEGLAIVMSHDVARVELQVAPPGDEWLEATLTMELGEFHKHRRKNDREVVQNVLTAGAWIVLALDLNQLRALATRADGEGLERIPPEWFWEVLPESRHTIGRGPIVF